MSETYDFSISIVGTPNLKQKLLEFLEHTMEGFKDDFEENEHVGAVMGDGRYVSLIDSVTINHMLHKRSL